MSEIWIGCCSISGFGGQQVDDPWRGQVLLFEFLVLLLLLLKNLVQSTKTRHVRVILCQTLAAHPSNPKVEIA